MLMILRYFRYVKYLKLKDVLPRVILESLLR